MLGTRDELEIRLASPADEEEIVALIRRCLGETNPPWTLEYWRWKHEANPFGRSPCLLAVDEGRIVGLRVFMRWRWAVGRHTVPAVRAVDTATHPDYRGLGIFSRLTLALVRQMEEEGVAFVYNTPNDQSRPGYLKMGWESLGRTTPWVRLVRPMHAALAMLNQRNDPRSQAETLASEESLGDDGQVAAELFTDEAARAFLDAVQGGDSRFHTSRSSDYLRWRYAEIPAVRYLARWDIGGGEGAVAFYRIKRHGEVHELRISDLVIGSGARSRRIGRRLLRELAGVREVDCITVMAPAGTPERRLALTGGFFPAWRRGPILTVRALNLGGVPDPFRLDRWRFSAGDLELF